MELSESDLLSPNDVLTCAACAYDYLQMRRIEHSWSKLMASRASRSCSNVSGAAR